MASVAGLWQFIIQRISGLVILGYVGCVGSEIMRSDLTFFSWISFMANPIIQAFTIVAWLSVLAHSWIGFKAILDDYITPRLLGSKAYGARFILIAVFWVAATVAMVAIIDFLRLVNAAV